MGSRSDLSIHNKLMLYKQILKQILGSCDRASWTWGEERETNKMQLIRILLSNFYLNMFRAS